jgi:hypothetical protein
MDEESALEQLALRRAAENGYALVVNEHDAAWEAVYEQDDALGRREILATSGPSPTRRDALERLLGIHDILPQPGEQGGG